ncbi:Protein priB [Cytospora mali]|uniref:Protein priB n=1 Tax=Cytospora mali TaxID=578113 RepID=A0A194VQJ2_CYTMA|nr:Protein priB [Valsa mali]
MEHPETAADTVTVKPEPLNAATSNGPRDHPDFPLSTTTSPGLSQYGQNGGAQTTSPPNEQRTPKIAACLSCRRSKVRCEKGIDPIRCRRCVQTGSDCGLEKALYQVEEALRRAGPAFQGTDAGKAISELKVMIASGQEPQLSGSGDSNKRPRLNTAASSEPQDDSSSEEEDSPRPRKASVGRRPSPVSHRRVKVEERLAVEDAENPLQLLARASNLHMSPVSSHGQSPGTATSQQPNSTIDDLDPEFRYVETFFGTTSFNIDRSEGYDPIELGLVTEDEAETLFELSYRSFHQNLAHTRWGLDPALYTVPWTRSRSSFLFTSIMAAASLFIQAAGALSRRLSNHCKWLANKVIEKRHRSTEIVLAFMINVPWMGPGVHSTDDETCWYVSMAATIAIDLQLPRISTPWERFRNGTSGDLARQDCMDPEIALKQGGFKDIDPNSELGRRLVRRRERCWIALFVLERGMCLARGRNYTIPITPLIRRCDRWHISDIADSMDGHLVSMAVLRRDLDDLFATIRSLCDGSREAMTDGSLIARSIQSAIDGFFEQWHLEWGMSIGTGSQHRLPPYVEILVTHTRLSIYSSVINHPTAPLEVRHFFRTAGLSAALNVMRAAVQGESELFSMPNNSAIMVSFAACFALKLSRQITGGSSSNMLAPSVRTLIEETADLLEKVGSITKHRNGMGRLYGKYLRLLVKKAASASEAPGPSRHGHGTPRAAAAYGDYTRQNSSGLAFSRSAAATNPRPASTSSNVDSAGFAIPPPPSSSALDTYGNQGWTTTNSSDLFQFSAMSDDQIVEALNRAGGEFDTGAYSGGMGGGSGGVGGSGSGFSWEDATNFDWMNWNNLPDFGF